MTDLEPDSATLAGSYTLRQACACARAGAGVGGGGRQATNNPRVLARTLTLPPRPPLQELTRATATRCATLGIINEQTQGAFIHVSLAYVAGAASQPAATCG